MYSTKVLFIRRNVIILGIILASLADCGRAYDMQEYCDKEIRLSSEDVYQIELELDDTYIYDRHWFFSNRRRGSCETTVRGWYAPYNKLMFYFEDYDLECEDGHLEFFSGRTGSTRVEGLNHDVCGGNKPRGVFTAGDLYMRIKYVSKKSHEEDDLFTIVITSYSDDESCLSGSYKCDNSRCIDRDIACNDYDSCGDGSGCDKQTTSMIIGATVGSVIFLACVVGVAVCCVCKNRKTQKGGHGNDQRASSECEAYSAPGNTRFSQQTMGFNQETYGLNSGGQYPTQPSVHYTVSAPNYANSAYVAPIQVPTGQPAHYSTNYMHTDDLPPPYSEVVGDNKEHNQPKEVINTDNDTKEQEHVYDDPGEHCGSPAVSQPQN